MSTLTVDLPDDLQPEGARLHLGMRLFETRTGFRLSDALYRDVLHRAGEG